MIGVNPPGNFLWDAKTTGEQVRRYAALARGERLPLSDARTSPRRCIRPTSTSRATGGSCRSRRATSAWRVLRPDQRDRRRRRPDRRPADAGHAALDRRGRRRRARGSSPSSPVRRSEWAGLGDVAADGRTTRPTAPRLRESGRSRLVLGSPGTELLWAGGGLLDAWPANPDENEYGRVRDSNVPTLLIGGELDFATPPQNAARELLPTSERAPGRAAEARSRRRLLGYEPAPPRG